VNRGDNNREELFDAPEEVASFAQAYYATEFPNGERGNCPSVEVLRTSARSGTLPDAALREHLFGCSECFRSYRSARLGYRSQLVAGNSLRQKLSAALSGFTLSLTTRRVALLASTACLLIFGCLAAAFVVWRTHEEVPAVALNNSRPGAAASQTPQETSPVALAPLAAVELKTPLPAGGAREIQNAQPRLPKMGKRAPRSMATLPIIEINLKEDGLLRGGDDLAQQRGINLARERQRLRLQLPERSGKGRYLVTVVDAFGKPLITKRVNSDGKTLIVNLDLRGLNAKQYRLCLTLGGESPDCYLVSVSDRAPRAVN
jgi:hypothetical protein